MTVCGEGRKHPGHNVAIAPEIPMSKALQQPYHGIIT